MKIDEIMNLVNAYGVRRVNLFNSLSPVYGQAHNDAELELRDALVTALAGAREQMRKECVEVIKGEALCNGSNEYVKGSEDTVESTIKAIEAIK